MHSYDLSITFYLFGEVFIWRILNEIIEIFWHSEKVFLFFELFVKFLHLDVGVLAENEHCNIVIGINVVEIWHKGRYKFKNKHNVISFMKILFLKGLEYVLLLLFSLSLLHHSFHINWLTNIIDFFKLYTTDIYVV